MSDNWFEVYGTPGAKYMKDGRYYDVHKRLLEADADGNLITTMPPPAEKVELEAVDRIKIKSPADPNFLKKSDIQRELLAAKIKVPPQAGREELLVILKNYLGVTED